MKTGGITRENASLENCAQNLNFSPSDGLQTISGNELWRKHGPQTLEKINSFIGRVVNEKFAT